MRTERSREGYLIVDHRGSPGTTEVGEGQVVELATSTCSHCTRVVVLNPKRTRERARCHNCFRYVCDTCAGILKAGGACLTFDKLADETFERAAREKLLGDLNHG